MKIRSFTGLRPSPEAVASLVSLPYDVVSTEEARALAADNPLSFLRVVRAEIAFPPDQDPYADEVYAQAARQLQWLQEEGHLQREEEPCLYLYRQAIDGHAQTGVVAVSHVDDYDADRIRKHERTRVAKENDRTRLAGALRAHAGPVFLTYRDQPALTALVEEACREMPLYDLTTADGVRHTVWRVPGGEALVDAFAEVDFTHVADGHHRAASAARVARQCREANPDHRGDEDYNYFLTALFPASELRILPYNRLLVDARGRSPEELEAALATVAALRPAASPAPARPHDLGVFTGNRWKEFSLVPDPAAPAAAQLDVSLLQEQVLAPLFGIEDPRTDERVTFVGGIRGTDYLAEQVRSGKAALAFSLYPVPIDSLLSIADEGDIMPPKSTWFEPKLRSGFFLHTF
jgi:uncharacterized protein (DUF1015 family)